MSGYHISSLGELGSCTAAQGRCPYGSAAEHFLSHHEAQIALVQRRARGEFVSIPSSRKVRFKKEQLRVAESGTDPGMLLDVAQRIQPDAHGLEIAKRLVANAHTPPVALVEARARTIGAYEQFAFIEAAKNYPLSNLTEAGAMAKVDYTLHYDIQALASGDDVADAFFDQLALRYPQFGALAAANLNNRITPAALARVANKNPAVAKAAAQAGRWPSVSDVVELNNYYSNARPMTDTAKAKPECLVFAAQYSTDPEVLKTLGMRFGMNSRNFDERVVRALIDNPSLDPASRISLQNALTRNLQ